MPQEEIAHGLWVECGIGAKAQSGEVKLRRRAEHCNSSNQPCCNVMSRQV